MTSPGPTNEQVSKLPRWAQEYIKDLVRERLTAIRSLNEFVDSTTESGIWYEDHPCTGETRGPVAKRKYIQSDHITVAAHGLEMRIRIQDDRIQIAYSNASDIMDNVILVPSSFQTLEFRKARK